MFENTCNKCGAGLQPGTYFSHSSVFYNFLYTLGTPIFRNTWECLLFIFFIAVCQARIYSLHFFVSSKNQTLLQFLLSVVFANILFFSLFFKKFTHIKTNVWQHYFFSYLLFTILHKYSKIQNFKEPMKATETAVDMVLDVSINSHGNVCSEVLGKVVGCLSTWGLLIVPD